MAAGGPRDRTPPPTPRPVPAPPPISPSALSLSAGPFAPATTPAPELKTPRPDPRAPARSGNGVGEQTAVDVRPPPASLLAAANDQEETPRPEPIDQTTKPLTALERAVLDMGGKKASTEDASADGRAEAEQELAAPEPIPASAKERRELPTQRLRAVSASLADPDGEVPERPIDPEAETPSPTSAPPSASMAKLASGGGLTPAATTGRQSWLAYAGLGVAAALIITVVVYKYMASPEPPAITVSAMAPSPTTVYRFWEPTAKVDRVEAPAFQFANDGKVAEIAAVGTRYGAGDVLALLDSGRRFRTELAHNRERLGYYEQMRETMAQQNNKVEVRQAELKIAEKQRLIAEAQDNLNKHAVVAVAPGEISEALAAVGSTVKAGEPVLRAKGSAYRASFELPREQAEKARQLGFCRVEIDGNPLDCKQATEGGDDTHVIVELPSDAPVAAGKTVKLARDRLDAVFPVPASALLRVGDSDRLYVVAPSNRAELRVVAVQDRSGDEAIITQGLDVGDRVIIDSPQGLKPDARVLVRETVTK